MKVRTLLVLLTLVTALLGQTAPTLSTAAFTSTSSTAESTIRAAADWTPPKVTMNSPGSAVRDIATVSATATDADSAVRSVTLEHRGPGATGWTELCATTSAPYSCAWNTKDGDDGAHSLRAVAIDTHGNIARSDIVTTTVANQVAVVVSAPSQTIRGAATLTTTLHNAGSTPYRVGVEFAPAGTDRWSTACADLRSPFTCSGNTVAMPDGVYDLRATASAGDLRVRSEVVRSIRVDNTAPSVTMKDPGQTLAGTRTFESTATDGGSGVAQVRIQYAAAGGSWTDLCTDSSHPYSCEYDTKKLTDGTYSFRALATDLAGNTATSPVVPNRTVKNTVSEVAMTNPASTMSRTVALRASASSTAGVSSVAMQYATSGSNTWTTACTVTRSPYSCNWDSAAVANGSYSFRAVLTDGNGTETVSSPITGVRVTNTVLEALGIQVYNGRSAGEVDAGDTINYIFSEQVDLDSLSAGWSGGSRSATVRLQDNGSSDRITILRGGSTVNLGSFDLGANYINWGQTVTFDATMTPTTTWFDGAWRTSITVTLGWQAGGSSWSLVDRVSPSVMYWSPSAGATNRTGTGMSTAPVGVWSRF
ncbi:Ig-like domain-containing protein [Nesterenkonia sp. CF4.4]|uniref:Ig-like domain-containing protein n=1 Tax=Nesterenkonia sp. CF4.4 TaxID=3373079 RepID=UPI003EE7D5CA